MSQLRSPTLADGLDVELAARFEKVKPAAHAAVAVAAGAITGLTEVDTAAVGPCPKCKTPVRRLALTPIGGSGLDAHPAKRSWCADCIQAKTTKAWKAAKRKGRTIPPPATDEPQENTT